MYIHYICIYKRCFFQWNWSRLFKQEKNNFVNPAISISSAARLLFIEERDEGISTVLYNHSKTYAGLRFVDIIQISCVCKAVAWNLYQVAVELDSWLSLENLQGWRFHRLSGGPLSAILLIDHFFPIWHYLQTHLKVCFDPQARLIIKTLSNIDSSSNSCVILRRDIIVERNMAELWRK